MSALEAAFASDETRDVLAALSDERRARLRRYWLDRAEGELTTALSFEFVLADLREEGLPEALTGLAERTIAEEHVHADWCLRWANRLATEPVASAHLGGTRPASFAGASAHDDRLLRPVFAGLSETVAVHVLRSSQDHITLPAVRLLNQLHMKEEVDHARVGWAVLAWPGLREDDRRMIASHVAELLDLVRRVWLGSDRPRDPVLEQLGFLSTPLVHDACEEAIRDVVIPGLVHHRVH